MIAGVAVFVVLLFGLGSGLVLYGLVRAEHGQRTEMARSRAELAARRDASEGDDS